jgi:lysophospholipase L1-like esterase
MTTNSSFLRPAPAALAAVTGAAAIVGVWRYVQLLQCLKAGDRLADEAVPCERCGKPHAPSVLVVGDSTGVGTGAAKPEESIAGRLATAFPEVSIVNRARNGAKTLDAISQLADESTNQYELVLIHVGGNDVLRGTPVRVLTPQIDVLMQRALHISKNVVVTTLPNLGLLPMFFPPLSWWLSRQSRLVCSLFAQAAARHGVHYVDFFHPRPTDQFARHAVRYFACDRLHPSSDLYAFVYESVVASTPISALLQRPLLGAVEASQQVA